MRIAVIDMGTNIYNLLLAEVSHGEWRHVHEIKHPSRLGDGGLDEGILSRHAFVSALEAMSFLTARLSEWGGAEQVYAFATSAVRDAKNRLDFTKCIEEKYNIPVQVISGDREAELIYKGIKQVAHTHIENKPALMIDIGGGSNEFIIADAKQIYWKCSFPLGMARLLEQFKPGNPITSQEEIKIRNYLDQKLTLLWEMSAKCKITALVGSSGSFDTYRALLAGDEKSEAPLYPIRLNDFAGLYRQLLQSTTEERLSMKGMTPVRVDFIVLAVILTHLVIEKIGINTVIQCDYSLKEGIIQEIVEQQTYINQPQYLIIQ